MSVYIITVVEPLTVRFYIPPSFECISKLRLPSSYPCRPFPTAAYRERHREELPAPTIRENAFLSVPPPHHAIPQGQIQQEATAPSKNNDTPSVSIRYVSFCLIKKDRRCDSCQAHVTPSTVSWIRIQRTTRPLVLSDWSRNSASRSCFVRNAVSICLGCSVFFE